MNYKPIAEADLEKIKQKNAIYYGVDKVELFHGIKDCLINSKALFASAQKIADGDLGYGAANSLLILAGEECVKGYVLLSVYFGIELKFAIEPYFRSHSSKHNTGKEILELIKVASMLSAFFGRKGKGESLLELIEMATGNTKDKMWWDTADDQKKNGFYVDFKDGKFHSPTKIELKNYSESVRLVSRYIDSLSMVEKLKPDDYKTIPSMVHRVGKKSV